MRKLVVIKIGEGHFKLGFPVTLYIGEEGDRFHTSLDGKLPLSPIDSLYDKWQSEYRQKVSGRMTPAPAQVANCSDSDLIESSNLLKQELNNWLNSGTFRPIKDKFQQKLKTDDTVRVIIQTENHRLRRLPWYLWDLFDSYRLTEVALSSPAFERVDRSVQPKPKVRILAILGDSSPGSRIGIRLDLNADKQFWESLPDAETVFLGDEDEPSREKFNEQLWDKNGWDILFFAGHSSSNPDGTTGKMYINSKESLTITELKYALQKAIERGLQLAIFNSCDGLGIARDLAELQIPQIIVMREPVPDGVAQNFLKYFLSSFSSGKSLYLAVREAREGLQGVEKEVPCASWLPVICQNLAENPVTWQGLRGIEAGINWRETCQNALAERQKLTTNSLTTGDGVEFTFDDIYVPLGLVEKVKKEKRPGEVSPESGSQFYQPEKEYEEVTRTYKNDEFFAQVLKQGQSPKSQGRRLAVTGEPGAGKTTLLQKIAQWVAAETEQDVAIWVSLTDLQGRSVEDYLLQKWLKDALGAVEVTPEMKEALALLFKSGRVWLLLDGVDEMGSSNPLATVANQISGWVASARVVVTCRQNVWDAGKNALEGFDVYRNLDFDYPEGVGQFIHRWFARHRELGERLLAELAQDGKERIRDTVRNPLRLALLCRAWQIRQGGLPETKAGLYGQFAEALYVWKQEAFPTTEDEQEELNAALGRLALRGMEQSESRFRLKEGLVREILGKKDKPPFSLALQLGWLNLVGVAVENPDERVYAFYHPTFQEYFAALAVDDWSYFLHHVPDNPRLGIYRIFEKQWKEVILLWFGRENVQKEKKEAFIENLINFDDGCGDWNYRNVDRGFYGYQAYFLAAAGIAELKQSTWSDNIVEQLVKFLFGYLNQEQKRIRFIVPISDAARDVLPHTAKPKAITKLTNLLSQNIDEGLQVEVSENLGKIDRGNELAIRKLAEVLASNENESNRQNLANILREIAVGNEGAIQELIKVSQSAYKSYTRKRWVAYSLGEIGAGNQTAITELIKVTQKSNCDLYTRALISYTLGQIDSDDYKLLIQSLIRLLANSENQDIRTEVTETLSRLNPGYQLALKDLMDKLSNPEKQVSKWRLEDIIQQIAVDNEFAIRELIRLLVMPDSKNIRSYIANILEVIAVGHELAIRELTRLSKDTEYQEIHPYANSILNKIAVGRGQMSVSNELAILELMRVLENSDNEANLRQIHGAATPWYFEQLLEELRPDSDRHDIRDFIHGLEYSKNPSIPWFIARCLEEIIVGNELAVNKLISVLEASNNPIYINVATNLQNVKPTYQLQRFEKLVRVLESTNDERTRRQVSLELREMQLYNSVIRALIGLLSEKYNEIIRKQVADCLREMFVSHYFAIQKLIGLSENEFDSHFYRRLEHITPSNNLRKIWQLIGLLETNTNQSVRKQAGYSLQQYYFRYQFDLDLEKLFYLLTRTDNERQRSSDYWVAPDPRHRTDMNSLYQELFERDGVNELTRNTQQLTDWLERNYSNVMQRIDPGNELAIGLQELMRLLGSRENQSNQNQVLNSLKAIADSESAIRKNQPASESADNEIDNQANLPELISLLESGKDRTSCRQVANRINEMLTTREQYIDVVAFLSHNLTNEVYKSNYNLFYYCYKLLWKCAENLSYPEFYIALHQQQIHTPTSIPALTNAGQEVQEAEQTHTPIPTPTPAPIPTPTLTPTPTPQSNLWQKLWQYLNRPIF
ncbi:MAG: NACHT domain-containing protein [Microcoleus sp.]